jgi:hypothetical protein
MTWSLTTPGDTDAIRAGDDKIREFKDDLEDALSEEHSFPINGANPACYHNLPSGTTAARPVAATGKAGRWYYNTTTGTIQRDNGTSWDDLTDGVVIESGTVMFFCQTTPPSGWTRSTSINNRMLRVVTGSGGGTGGEATITFAAENFPHAHGGTSGSGTFPSGHSGNMTKTGYESVYPDTGLIISSHTDNGSHVHSIENNNWNHGHTIEGWTPKYKDLIMAIKN